MFLQQEAAACPGSGDQTPRPASSHSGYCLRLFFTTSWGRGIETHRAREVAQEEARISDPLGRAEVRKWRPPQDGGPSAQTATNLAGNGEQPGRRPVRPAYPGVT